MKPEVDFQLFLKVTQYTINKNTTKFLRERYYDIYESRIFEYIVKGYQRYNSETPLVSWLCLNAYYGYLEASREVDILEKKEIRRNIATKEYSIDKGLQKNDPVDIILDKENLEYSKQLLDEMCYKSGVTDLEQERLVEFVDGQRIKDISKNYTCSYTQVATSIHNAIKKIKEVVEI